MLNRRLAAALLFLLFCVNARADWRVLSSEQQGVARGGVVHIKATAADQETNERATIHLAVFSTKSATLRVIDDPAEGRPDLAATMERENCVAGVNGGYFTPEYEPVGLLISDGRVIAPQRKARLLSGVVSVAGGRVRIQRVAEFSLKSKPTAARQSGPFLVEGAKAVVGLNKVRPARRTFVATGAGERAAIGYSSHLTLAQLGALLATAGLAPDFKIDRALNLDGGSSSGFWFRGESTPFSIREQKAVRDYIGVVAK